MQKTLRTFRLAGHPHEWPLIEALLKIQGFGSTPLPFYPQARVLDAEPTPLGGSLAARFGYIYIQDASSMLPALALHQGMSAQEGGLKPAPGGQAGPPLQCLLDMCASPGGKTSLLAQLAGPHALVLGNEPSPKRLATLRRNLEGLGLLNTATTAFAGEALPLPSAALPLPSAQPLSSAPPLPSALPQGVPGPEQGFGGFDHILLDPPCSGWGTAEKHPQVLTLWQGDKVKPLIGLQRLLLREAVRLLRPGGYLSYSTCTVNVQENEEQIRWALTELNAELGGEFLELVPLPPFAGFTFDAPLLGCHGTLRVAQGSALGQGFYIALLRKSPLCPPLPPGSKAAKVTGPAGPGKPGKGKAARAPRNEEPEAKYLEARLLDSPLTDPKLLPPGSLLLRRGQLSFAHAAGLAALPTPFAWGGYLLGKAPSAAAAPRINTTLRALMPAPEVAQARGASILQVEEAAPILALLSGQSLKLATSAPEVGLYYKTLPLCRLKAKNGRVFI